MMEPVHRFCSSAHERVKLKVSGPFLSASPRSQAQELSCHVKTLSHMQIAEPAPAN